MNDGKTGSRGGAENAEEEVRMKNADPTGLQVFAAERHLKVAVGFSLRSRSPHSTVVAERHLQGRCVAIKCRSATRDIHCTASVG